MIFIFGHPPPPPHVLLGRAPISTRFSYVKIVKETAVLGDLYGAQKLFSYKYGFVDQKIPQRTRQGLSNAYLGHF